MSAIVAPFWKLVAAVSVFKTAPHESSLPPGGHKTRANTLYVPLWLTLNEKSIYPALFVGALAVLLLPD